MCGVAAVQLSCESAKASSTNGVADAEAVTGPHTGRHSMPPCGGRGGSSSWLTVDSNGQSGGVQCAVGVQCWSEADVVVLLRRKHVSRPPQLQVRDLGKQGPTRHLHVNQHREYVTTFRNAHLSDPNTA